jgi:uncharacterized RDD family membrane protein YckC
MVYEAILLFGIVVIVGLIYAVFVKQQHALYMRDGLQMTLLFVVSVYFLWFWTHGGQTLPMKTWRMRLVTEDGQSVSLKRAIGRYLLAWLWCLPGLAIASALNAKGWTMALIPAGNAVLWALTIFLDPQRQFLHDRIAGTRIVSVPDQPKTASRK